MLILCLSYFTKYYLTHYSIFGNIFDGHQTFLPDIYVYVLLWTRVWQVLFMVFGPFHWMQIKKSEIKLHHTVQKKGQVLTKPC